MTRPPTDTRASGLTVVRRTTLAVAAVSFIGTGAFTALHSRGRAEADTTPQARTAAPPTTACTTDESDESHDDHHADDDHDEDDDHHGEGDHEAENCVKPATGSFKVPATAPMPAATARPQVTSGGS